MTDNIVYEEHLRYNFRKLYRFLASLPLKTYLENVYLQSAIKISPLQALLIGREIMNPDYDKRVKPWIEEAILNSPHLNN